MTDFAVKVTHLPKVTSYDQLEEMAAALAAHICEVVEQEPQVFHVQSASGSNAANEIVSIDFTRSSFKDYK